MYERLKSAGKFVRIFLTLANSIAAESNTSLDVITKNIFDLMISDELKKKYDKKIKQDGLEPLTEDERIREYARRLINGGPLKFDLLQPLYIEEYGGNVVVCLCDKISEWLYVFEITKRKADDGKELECLKDSFSFFKLDNLNKEDQSKFRKYFLINEEEERKYRAYEERKVKAFRANINNFMDMALSDERLLATEKESKKTNISWIKIIFVGVIVYAFLNAILN